MAALSMMGSGPREKSLVDFNMPDYQAVPCPMGVFTANKRTTRDILEARKKYNMEPKREKKD